MIVVDASVMVAALADSSPSGDASRSRLTEDPHWVAPTHMPIEVLRALAKHARCGDISSAAAEEHADTLASAQIDYSAPTPAALLRIWALRHNISAYDAAYVVLAETFDVPLLTHDKRLARAAHDMCTVHTP
ncbi:putative nucleic acid-binding protein [Haloactinopolyspora alba]|uniref:Ribonuclease VapC n=1 Tax=Haloactinopolyspora alba TaxID=648780 RepID=A0A2P8E003_9ACTN|nr:type II toxin-antitoxin system VapC family toxin [Haloactinopolyspora alba]PSL02796.1 putative nucleic acid-binding protein [Haloactinopolyspora alba]